MRSSPPPLYHRPPDQRAHAQPQQRVHSSSLRLIFRGRFLEDWHTLSEVRIADGHSLHATFSGDHADNLSEEEEFEEGEEEDGNVCTTDVYFEEEVQDSLSLLEALPDLGAGLSPVLNLPVDLSNTPRGENRRLPVRSLAASHSPAVSEHPPLQLRLVGERLLAVCVCVCVCVYVYERERERESVCVCVCVCVCVETCVVWCGVGRN
jgi:Ubiquitin family